jgi:hypothetical protein
MPTLAEMMFQSVSETNTKMPDTVGAGAKGAAMGAQLAQTIETAKTNRANLEQKKQELEMSKFEKVGGWFDTASKMPEGKVKAAFVNEYITKGISALGLQDKIDPTALKMFAGDPMLGAYLKAKVESKEMSYPEMIMAMKDPVKLAEIMPKVQQFGDEQLFKDTVEGYSSTLGEAHKYANTEKEKFGRAVVVADKTADRQEADDARAGQKKLSELVAGKYSEYSAGGGKAGMESSLSKLDEVVQVLENGTVKTGGKTTVIPWLKSDDFQSMANPKMVEYKTQAQAAINSVLKVTLGTAFTEGEGIRVLNQVWDDRQSPSVNAKKVRAKAAELRANVKNSEGEFKKFGYIKEEKSTEWKSDLKSKKDKAAMLPPEEKTKFIELFSKKYNVSIEEVKKALGD